MTVGHLNLTVFSAALFCFGTVVSSSSQAAPQRPWYLAAFDSVLRVVVNNDDQAAVLKDVGAQPEQVYVSRLIKEENTITLKGHVPSEGDLKVLQGVLAATSPGATVVYKNRLNANVPDRDTWLAAMTFALRQLGKLESGSAVLRNTMLTIEGMTKPDDDFVAIQKRLRDEAPKGLALQYSLKPHDAHPFVWLAQLQSGALTLSGHVPNEQDQALLSYAANLFQNMKVSNGMALAVGEPQDWLAAAKVALDMLSLLYSGNVTISDNVIRLDGIYSSPAVVEVFKAYKQRAPKGYRIDDNILQPVARAPSARAEDYNLAARNVPAAMNP